MIGLICCYFTELFPSITIMVILWKSFKEMELNMINKELSANDKTESEQTKPSNYQSNTSLKKHLLETRQASDFYDNSLKKSSLLSFSLISEHELESTSKWDDEITAESRSFLTYY
uniref:Uncharacterized protein n=1 Tax=Euplotes crassus TaxID=5936 RepID=A0A7S3NZJ1_EUPCR|mmetsp:Transcript_36212/g.35820  ORF Transcript_36212/g.35820 Transcript_36212/m.35820 type:complete len:116 (+) Transcript_36212:734-1081(+)